MTDNTKENFDDSFMVPERDEMRTHGSKRQRGTSLPLAKAPVQLGTSGGVKALLSLLVLGLFATGGAAYFFYEQGLAVNTMLDEASGRLRQLESRLLLTDEVAQESSLGFLERVDFNFSEIDKLWAARNQNRSNVTANKVALEGHGETLNSMERVISGQSTTMNETIALLGTVETRIETLATNLSGMDNLAEQLVSIKSDIAQVKQAMNSQGTGLAGRVDSNEQDIESINIYRLQLNQTLNSIQNSINNLQQQIGAQ